MRVLGIDIGMKRTGLALSDELGISVRVLPNLVAKSRAMALEKLLSLVNEFEVQAIIIGLPENRTEHSKAVATRALGLAEALKALISEQNLNVEVYLVDEYHSSKAAVRTLLNSGVGQKQRKTKLDGAAAAIMVERYLGGIKSQE